MGSKANVSGEETGPDARKPLSILCCDLFCFLQFQKPINKSENTCMLINVTEYRRGNNKRHARETGNIGYTRRKTKQITT
jgi:hypothetical protein